MNIRRWSPRVDLPQNDDLTDLTELVGAGGSHRRGHSYSWVEITSAERDEAGDVETANTIADPAAVKDRKALRAARRTDRDAARNNRARPAADTTPTQPQEHPQPLREKTQRI